MRRLLLFAVGSPLLVVGAALLWGAVSLQDDDLGSHPDPSMSYEESLARFEEIEAQEDGRVTELTRSRLLSTGAPGKQVYILIHGTTNSPHQFAEMGELLHANGHNVLILRLPRHGLVSHDVSELRDLTGEELRRYADEATDLAAGLGDEITVIGLSGGGAVGAWIVQNRPEVERAVCWPRSWVSATCRAGRTRCS